MALTETSLDFKVPSDKLKEKIKSLEKDTSNGKLINLTFMLLKIEKESSIHWEAKLLASPMKLAFWNQNLKLASMFKEILKNMKSKLELLTQRSKNSNRKLELKRLIMKANWETRTQLSDNYKKDYQVQAQSAFPSQKTHEWLALNSEPHQTLTEWVLQCTQVQAVFQEPVWVHPNMLHPNPQSNIWMEATIKQQKSLKSVHMAILD